MKKLLLCTCVAFAMALMSTSARAADVTGSWTAEMASPDGNSFQIDFTFKQDGAKLTGAVQGPDGSQMAISNGKVDGNHISFDVSFNEATIHHEGTINQAGDEIDLTTKTDSGNIPGGSLTLKRAKSAAEPGTLPPAPQPHPQ